MKESIGILGAGITGLATAYVLASKHNVTIVARDLPGDLGLGWASPWYVLFNPTQR
jgi:glycine/D-amino acid oxidase-like deaminating enzyme